MISYAQNFEDVILNRIFSGKHEGFYVDIGACHPIHDSVTKYFHELGWRGINIEPLPDMYELLREDRPEDINLQAAITDRSGEIKLYIPTSPANSTCASSVAKTYSDHGEQVNNITVKTMTLNELWSIYVLDTQVDFLKIDIEGLESVVLKSANFELVRPSILVIEATRPQTSQEVFTEWEHLLSDHYSFFYFDGLNRFYHRYDYSLEIDSLTTPPNVFDNFSLWQEESLKRQLSDAVRQNELLMKRITEDAGNACRERNSFKQAIKHAEHINAKLEKAVQQAEYAKSALEAEKSKWEQSVLGRIYRKIYK